MPASPEKTTPTQEKSRGVLRQPERGSYPENFIPLRKHDLKELLPREPTFTPRQREQFAKLCQLLEAAIHYEFHHRLEELKTHYAPFDPDLDCSPQREWTTTEREISAKEFVAVLGDLLDRANYQHITAEQLDHALDQASRLGFNMEVDFHIFQRLEIYARGKNVVTKPLPGMWNRTRGKTIEVPVFERLVVLFRLKPESEAAKAFPRDTIFIKIFKDIPESDIDMLLPGTRVRMTWLDQGKIILPTLSGVGFTIYKIIMGTLKIAFAGVFGLIGFVGILLGTFGYASRSFYSYLNTKDKYHLNLARNLYYQNLDSNAGVMYRLLDEAEEQEFREAIIAYFLLWKHAGPEGWEVAQIDRAAEEWIQHTTRETVDFEIGDALEKLAAMKLIVPSPGGRWRAVDFDQGLRGLDRAWDLIFTNEHIQGREY